MSPAEQALADAGGPTFADLCWRVREARRSHKRALARARPAITAAEATLRALEDATAALDAYVAQECADHG